MKTKLTPNILRHFIWFAEAVQTPQRGGGRKTEVTNRVQLWAGITPSDHRVVTGQGQLEAVAEYEVLIRWRPDVKRDWIVRSPEGDLLVLETMDPKTNREWLVLFCQKGGFEQ